MVSVHCDIGELTMGADGILTLAITCTEREISRDQMEDAVRKIDGASEIPVLLLVDAREPHSLSFDALTEMNTGKNIRAVAIYAPSGTAKIGADYVMEFQKKINLAPYPFRVFSDIVSARKWLTGFKVG